MRDSRLPAIRSPRLPRVPAILTLCVSLAAVALAQGVPTGDGEAQVRLARLLADYRTRDQLTGFVGVPPDPCVACSRSTELCEWRAGPDARGWRSLSELLGKPDAGFLGLPGIGGGDDEVSLLCELPKDGSARARDSCSVHPRRSNRDEWDVPTGSTSSTRALRTWDRMKPTDLRAARARVEQQAKARIAAARTLVALSRLVGAAPDQCVPSPLAPERQVCLWRATNETEGHGTLAVSVLAPMQKKMRMSCELPLDGSPRAPDSCFVEEGS